MARLAVRLQVVEIAVGLGLVLLVARAAEVQLLQGRRWAEEAQAQRTERIVLAARRGALLDRHGTPLALTQETYHVGVAPNELRDPVKDGALIARRLPPSARRAGPAPPRPTRPRRTERALPSSHKQNIFYSP